MKYFILLITALLFYNNNLSAESVDFSNIKSIIEQETFLVDGKKITGDIKNIQVSPIDKDLISFEVVTSFVKDREEGYIMLYNLKSEKSYKISSKDHLSAVDTRMERYFMDQDVAWHPNKNWFFFYGNSYRKRKLIFACEIKNPQLLNSYAIEIHRLEIDEEKKGRNEGTSYYRHPAIDKDGDNLYFSRNIYFSREDNTSYNIWRIPNLNSIISSKKFDKLQAELVIEKDFHQFHPVPSPTDPSYIAYVSLTNQARRGQRDYYPEYNIELYNTKTKENFTVDNMDGYEEEGYPFIWSNHDMKLAYFKAVERFKTPQDLIDDKKNMLNLYFIDIGKTAPKLLIKDARGLWNGLAFINKTHLIASKYNQEGGASFVLVNLNKISDNEEDFVYVINPPKEGELPVLFDNAKKIYYLQLNWIGSKYQNAVSLADIKFNLDLTVPIAEKPVDKPQDDKKSKLENLEKQLVAYKEDSGNKLKEINFIVQENEKLKKDIQDYKNEITKHQVELPKLLEELDKIKQEKQDFDKDRVAHLNNKIKELEDLKQKLIDITASIEDENKQREDNRNRLTELVTEINENQSKMAELRNEINQLKITQVQKDSESKERLQQLENILVNLKEELRQKEEEIKITQNQQVEDLNQNKRREELINVIKSTEIPKLESEIAELKQLKESGVKPLAKEEIFDYETTEKEPPTSVNDLEDVLQDPFAKEEELPIQITGDENEDSGYKLEEKGTLDLDFKLDEIGTDPIEVPQRKRRR